MGDRVLRAGLNGRSQPQHLVGRIRRDESESSLGLVEVCERLWDGKELADLLTWVVLTFDPGHVPAHFQPYGAAEVAALRKVPLISQSGTERARILALPPTLP